MSPPDDQELHALHQIISGFSIFQALLSGVRVGLFETLAASPGLTLEPLAERCGLPRHSMRVLALGLASSGLIERDGEGAYRNSHLTERFLLRGTPGNVLPLVELSAVQYHPYEQLAEALRTGTNAGLSAHPGPGKTLYERLAHHPELERVYHAAISMVSGHARDSFGGVPELARARHLLDVGGGAGTNAMAVHHFYPALRVTIFDLPSVCAMARRAVEAAGLSQSIAAAEGDMRKDPFPSGCDAILFSNVLQWNSEETIRSLLAKSYAALPARGTLVVRCIAADDQEMGGDYAAKISLFFVALATGTGMAYPLRDYERWMREAGFATVARYGPFAWEHHLVCATK